MTTTLCLSGNLVEKLPSTFTTQTDAVYTSLINQAEGEIASDTGIDYVAVFAGISDNTKKVLEGAASNKAVIYLIAKEVDSIGRGTVTIMTNIYSWAYDKAIARLKDDKVKTLLGVTD